MTEQKRFLTKSRFKLATECPTKLFYTKKKEYADQKIDDPFLAQLANGGFQVGHSQSITTWAALRSKGLTLKGPLISRMNISVQKIHGCYKNTPFADNWSGQRTSCQK